MKFYLKVTSKVTPPIKITIIRCKGHLIDRSSQKDSLKLVVLSRGFPTMQQTIPRIEFKEVLRLGLKENYPWAKLNFRVLQVMVPSISENKDQSGLRESPYHKTMFYLEAILKAIVLISLTIWEELVRRLLSFAPKITLVLVMFVLKVILATRWNMTLFPTGDVTLVSKERWYEGDDKSNFVISLSSIRFYWVY